MPQSDISKREPTTANVDWTPRPWNVAEQSETTIDFSSVVQELVDQPGWNESSPVVVMFNLKTGVNARRRAVGAGGRTGSPVLVVTFEGSLSNMAHCQSNMPVSTGPTATASEQGTVGYIHQRE